MSLTLHAVSYEYVTHVGKIIDATIERRPQPAILHNTIHLGATSNLGFIFVL